MSGHTKGRAEVFRKTSVDSCDSTLIYVWFDVVIDGQIVHDGDGIYNPTNEEEAELKAYSALIAEAFNTYTDTGRTPQQLADERAELVAALEGAEIILAKLDTIRHLDKSFGVLDQLRAILAKVKGPVQ